MDNPILKILMARKATRSISRDSLPENLVAELMEAIRLTPSCYNMQPWRFLFLQSSEALTKGHQVLSAGNHPWASRAPLLVIGYAKKKDDCILPDGRAYYQFDVGMSVMNLMLSATHLGLVARPIAGWDPMKVKELFKLESEDEPIIVIVIGFPSDDESHLAERYKGADKRPRVRKDVSEIITRY
jgi:nitroreductase